MNYHPEQIKRLKEQYPPGTRIELLSMNDPYTPIPPGSVGEVRIVDDAGTLHMTWDNGRSLGVIPGEDQFRVLFRPETVKLYSPLRATYYAPDPACDFGESEKVYELPADSLAGAEKEIRKTIEHWFLPEEKERGLIIDCDADEPLVRKLQSVFPSVEQIDGELWGVGIFQTKENLSDGDMEVLKHWWNARLLDVFAPQFSQEGISCAYGEIFVDFRCGDESWQIYESSELPSNTQQMGGQSL